MKRYLRKAALALIIVSFLLCTFVIIADVGIHNTPSETTDSAGRTMGFNDHLSAEHYRIILSHFRFDKLLAPSYAYSGLLLIMHGLGAWLIIRVDGPGLARIRWFFAMQGLLFPIGWLGFLLLPQTVSAIMNRTLDREGMTDIPFIAATAHPIWIATAIIIFAASWSVSAKSTRPNER